MTRLCPDCPHPFVLSEEKPSPVIYHTTYQIPLVSCVIDHTSYLTPHTSYLTPHASHLKTSYARRTQGCPNKNTRRSKSWSQVCWGVGRVMEKGFVKVISESTETLHLNETNSRESHEESCLGAFPSHLHHSLSLSLSLSLYIYIHTYAYMHLCI